MAAKCFLKSEFYRRLDTLADALPAPDDRSRLALVRAAFRNDGCDVLYKSDIVAFAASLVAAQTDDVQRAAFARTMALLCTACNCSVPDGGDALSRLTALLLPGGGR